ncbi:MAG: hypothetical protein C4K60_16425 [Ideonella sp. MAG2]|nr:MAG: hypothetical protein C4K60_16425 [Ideonella sp. MAG2]
MNFILKATLPLALTLGLLGGATSALAQSKKELAAKVLQLQQAAIENMARELAERPAMALLQQADGVLNTRIPPEKRAAVGKEIQGDVKKYVDDAVPMLRDRAVKLGPSTIAPLLEEKLNEAELKEVIAMLESPAIRKYQALAGEMEKVLAEKLVAETRTTMEGKISALEQNVVKRLNAAAPAGGASAPAPAAKPAKK